jgi:AbrB family looped-hinge helix DNA binding protein
MKTTIDKAGRVVIPKELRSRLGLSGGHEVEITERDGRLEIEAPSVNISLVDTPNGVVAVPDRPLPPLTDEIVRDTLERVRR